MYLKINTKIVFGKKQVQYLHVFDSFAVDKYKYKRV